MNVTPELLEEITRQVLAALSAGTAAAGPKGLLVGGAGWTPSVPGCCWADEKEYQGDISPYTMVVCGQVSSAQLCDMALGRDTTPAACAVSKALLAGKPVYLAEEGLPHRASRATANPRYYAMLEDYVTRLTQFGVRVAPRAELERLLNCQTAPATAPVKVCEPVAAPVVESPAACEPFCGVLTAEEARRLAKTCGGTLRLGDGAILTPLARDVLRDKHITLLEEETPC
nr:hypothetical protein [uncultured Oscillibacter sp.]